ncbi:MAG TPA: lasso peptide biosynthesis B2 protein [Candidatus Limnocylindrales bacterium]|nr:lasso peptide biosynthesis B2 protein [Candidatus Limnocylindrales bacterium]
MTAPMALPERIKPPWRIRLVAHLAVALARLLARQPPGRIRRLLLVIRKGARPATAIEASAARRAVVAVSLLCAGEGCLQRSLATALLCRLRGSWPTWCTGVRTMPFSAHAWVEADGVPVDEPHPPGRYQPVITVPPSVR